MAQFGRCLLLPLLAIAMLKAAGAVETPMQRFAPLDTNHYQKSQHSECYDAEGQPQRCVPDFINAAFTRRVEVSPREFTCGVRRPNIFCVQTGTGDGVMRSAGRTCSECDARFLHQAHPPSLLTDFNNDYEHTWWQSVTLEQFRDSPDFKNFRQSRVNLTLRLNKAFDITYVSLKFASSRPESFAIYKRTRANDAWVPWQFYSGSCRQTFGLSDRAPIVPGKETMAQCTREFSDISPLTGGNIVFSTLEGRPSAENFEESEVLQEWVTATEIMISLVRLNTFGDEIFHDIRVLRTYFYAITDFAVGGRCKCNGHANQCVNSTGYGQHQLVCDCQHNTVGVDCQECAPLYQDRPWRPATSTEANECLPCQCNGLARRCFFDPQLFEQTGHGGHCLDCAGNTQGPHCERCLPKHWHGPNERHCHHCNCDPVGSLHEQCAELDGQCPCKPGVGGQRCDQCLPGFFGFGPHGCKDCQCHPAGTQQHQNGTATLCHPLDGHCACKPNVEGAHCERCKPGYFRLSPDNPFGCTPCFCFGHSSVCSAADGFYALNISSDFLENAEGWTARNGQHLEEQLEVHYDPQQKCISVGQQNSCDRFAENFHIAPPKFLGDQRLAYGQSLRFAMRKSFPYAWQSNRDIQLVGANGRVLSLPLGAQGNAGPSDKLQHYQFRIHADPKLQWNPHLREIDFIAVLSNLTEIRLRATFANADDIGYLSHFSLGTAQEGLHPEAGIPRRHADWVEQCQCPAQYGGQFCQHCALAHKRAQPFGGPFTKCVPCQCNGHAIECEAESGACKCAHNTAGDTCERCARGFYGDALQGTANDCKPCGCLEGGPCVQLEDGLVMCTECPEGYAGPRCDYCAEEHFGNPQAGQPCQRCNCNGNVDPNAIGQCDQTTGQCRRCIHHTTGWNCERCAPSFWGNALAETKSDCRPCNCYPAGTQRTGAGLDTAMGEVLECAETDGKCPCLPNVVGQRCAECAHGFFNISSGRGCQPCDCDPLGSVVSSGCDQHTGQCQCKPGVIGPKCDQCAPRHFGFGLEGCAQCTCHPDGAETSECDIRNGQCLCRDFVEGRQCDRCAENHYNIADGCPPCDDCYALIQRRKEAINGTMAELAGQLEDFRALPIPLNDSSQFAASVHAISQQLANFQRRADLLTNSKLVEQFRTAMEKFNTANGLFSETFGTLHSMGLDLGRTEFRLKKMEQEKSATQREIVKSLSALEKAGEDTLAEMQHTIRGRSQAEPALSAMAEEAVELVRRQEERTAKLRNELVPEIRRKSGEALGKAQRTVFEVTNSTSESLQLAELKENVTKSAKELNQTIKLAKKANTDADLMRDKSALLLANVERMKPEKEENWTAITNAGVHQLREEISQINEELEKARVKGAEMEAVVRDELKRSQEALKKAKAHAEEVEREFDLVSALEERAFEAARSAEDAIFLSDQTDRILDDTASGKQADSKAIYTQEVAESENLKKSLANTEQKQDRLEKNLARIQKQAERALRMALEAQEQAESVAKPLRELNANSEKLRARLKAASEELTHLEVIIAMEEENNQKWMEQSLVDGPNVEIALHDAVSTNNTAHQINLTLEEDEETLAVLLNRLNSIPEPPSESELDELEAKLEQMEKSYADSGVEDARNQIGQLPSSEESEIRKQIENMKNELGQLQNIARSLPTKCFNVVRIEQNGNH